MQNVLLLKYNDILHVQLNVEIFCCEIKAMIGEFDCILKCINFEISINDSVFITSLSIAVYIQFEILLSAPTHGNGSDK